MRARIVIAVPPLGFSQHEMANDSSSPKSPTSPASNHRLPSNSAAWPMRPPVNFAVPSCHVASLDSSAGTSTRTAFALSVITDGFTHRSTRSSPSNAITESSPSSKLQSMVFPPLAISVASLVTPFFTSGTSASQLARAASASRSNAVSLSCWSAVGAGRYGIELLLRMYLPGSGT